MEKQVKVIKLWLPGEKDVQRVLNSKVRVIRLPRQIPQVLLSVALVVTLWVTTPFPHPDQWT